MAQRKIVVVLLSEARTELAQHLVSQISPEQLLTAIRTGKSVTTLVVDHLDADELIEHYRPLAEAKLGTAYAVQVQADNDPYKVWVACVKGTALYGVEQVARGAKLLDQERPGWAREVVLDDLCLLSGTRCILGQVYGEYQVALRKLTPTISNTAEGDDERYAFGADFGFAVPKDTTDEEDDRINGRLKVEWTKAIKARLAA